MLNWLFKHSRAKTGDYPNEIKTDHIIYLLFFQLCIIKSRIYKHDNRRQYNTFEGIYIAPIYDSKIIQGFSMMVRLCWHDFSTASICWSM